MLKCRKFLFVRSQIDILEFASVASEFASDGKAVLFSEIKKEKIMFSLILSGFFFLGLNTLIFVTKEKDTLPSLEWLS